jgi:hypothetical protein
MADLPAFVDLITFFGLASFFAWLAYAPLQKDLLDDFEELGFMEARENFYTINDYFLVSFLFYSAAMVAEYLIHAPSIPMLGPNPIAHDPLLYFVIIVSFLGGLVTLATPMWYMRAVGKGNMNLATAKLPDFRDTLLIAGFATASLVVSAASFAETSIMALQAFWLLMGVVTLVGIVLAMKFFHSQIRQVVGALLVMIPIIARFVMSFLLHI